MKLCDRFRASSRPTLSLEVFPARTPQAATKLETTVEELISLQPDFFSVTFGAGGSTRAGSKDLVAKLKASGQEVLAYFACYGLGPQDICSVLEEYARLGVSNILAVRGDLPREDPSFSPHPEALHHASDLLEFVRTRFDFCLGAAGYPEGHVEAVSKDKDLEYLKLKVECGAAFVVANYFYDNQYFFSFRERCRSLALDVPIVPGVMPIFSLKMMDTLAGICGASIPASVREALASLPEGNKDAVVEYGIDLATKQCAELLRSGVPGIHLYTMDRSVSAKEIVRRLRAEGLLG